MKLLGMAVKWSQLGIGTAVLILMLIYMTGHAGVGRHQITPGNRMKTANVFKENEAIVEKELQNLIDTDSSQSLLQAKLEDNPKVYFEKLQHMNEFEDQQQPWAENDGFKETVFTNRDEDSEDKYSQSYQDYTDTKERTHYNFNPINPQKAEQKVLHIDTNQERNRNVEFENKISDRMPKILLPEQYSLQLSGQFSGGKLKLKSRYPVLEIEASIPDRTQRRNTNLLGSPDRIADHGESSSHNNDFLLAVRDQHFIQDANNINADDDANEIEIDHNSLEFEPNVVNRPNERGEDLESHFKLTELNDNNAGYEHQELESDQISLRRILAQLEKMGYKISQESNMNQPFSSDSQYRVLSQSNETLKFELWHPILSTNTYLGIVPELTQPIDNNDFVNGLTNTKPSCNNFYQSLIERRKILPNFFGACSGFNRENITMVLQMDLHRPNFLKLGKVLTNWNGPVSVSLYFSPDSLHTSAFYVQFMVNMTIQYRLDIAKVCFHIVRMTENENFFPINTLRNIGMRYAQSDRVFVSEADFLVPQGIVEQIGVDLSKQETLRNVALVVPSFANENTDLSIPQTKEELLEQWRGGITAPVQDLRSWKFGHDPTNYAMYRIATANYEVDHEVFYEPYYVVDKNQVPYYPEEVAFGVQDKAIHAHLLNRLGFKFVIMHDMFMVHTHHIDRNDRKKGIKNNYRCKKLALYEFYNVLDKTVPPKGQTGIIKPKKTKRLVSRAVRY